MSIYYWLYDITIGSLECIFIGKGILGLTWRKGKKGLRIAFLAFLAACCFLSRQIDESTFSYLWFMALLAVFFETKLSALLKSFLITCSSMALIDSFVWGISLLFTDDTVTNTNEAYDLVCGMIGFAIWCILFLTIYRKKGFTENNLLKIPEKQSVLLVIGLLAANFLFACMQSFLLDKMNVRMKKLAIVFLLIFIFYIFIIYGMFIRNYEKNKYLEEIAKISSQYFAMQKNYYLKSIEKYEELRSYRHDIRNHMQILQSLCEENQLDEVKRYAKRLNDDYKKTAIAYTGNIVVDCLLMEILGDLLNNNLIEFKILGHLPKDLPMDNVDICILFSNAFRNVSETLRKQDIKPSFYLITKTGRQEIKIVMQNSIEKQDINLTVTSKKDKEEHGYGVNNMKKVVEKYHGSISWDIVDGLMQVEIFLPIKSNAQKTDEI